MKCSKAKHRKPETGKFSGKRTARAVLNSLLAVVLVVGLAPSMSFAGEGDVEKSLPASDIVVEPEPENVDVPVVSDGASGDAANANVGDEATSTETDEEAVEKKSGESSDKSEASSAKSEGSASKSNETAIAKYADGETAPPTADIVVKKDSVDGEVIAPPIDDVYYYNGPVYVEMSVSNATNAYYTAGGGDQEIALTSNAGTEELALSAPTNDSMLSVIELTATNESGDSRTKKVTVIQDTEKPVVTVSYVDAEGGSISASEEDGDVSYFNLDGGKEVALKVEVSDKSALDRNSKIDVKWLNSDGSDSGVAGEQKSFTNKNATTTAFGAAKFVNNGLLLKAKVTVTVKDLAGNEPEGVNVYQFSSESGVLNLLAPKIKLVPADNVGNKDDAYNGDVVVNVGATANWDAFGGLINAEKSSVTINETSKEDATGSVAGNSYQWTASNGEEKGEKQYAVKATYTSTHGATKTIKKSFTIDTTTPELSVALNSGEAALSETVGSGEGAYDLYYFNSKTPPEVKIEVKDGSSLNSASANVQVKLNETDISNKVDWKSDGTATLSADLFNEATEYVVTVDFTGNDKFGTELSSEPKTTKHFLVDTKPPIVTAAFSKEPTITNPAEDSSSISEAIINKMQAAEEAAKITITVEDATFEPSDTNNTVRLDGKDLETSWSPVEGTTKYTFDIPYAGLDEKNGFKLVVTANDKAGNEPTIYDIVKSGENEFEEFSVDKSSPELDSFGLYEDEACTKAATAKKVDGDNYYVYEKLYGKLCVKDANLNTKNSTVVVYKGNQAVASLTDNNWVAYENRYYVTYEFAPGADYRLEVTANDLAGNGSLEKATDTFTIDYDSPAIAVVMQQPKHTLEGSASDWYTSTDSDGNVVAAIAVTDNTLASVEVTVDGQVTSYGPEDASSIKIPFAETAAGETHAFSVVATDKLGNKTTYSYGDESVEADGLTGAKSAVDSTEAAISGNSTFVVDSQKPDVAVNIDQDVHHTDKDKGLDYYNTVDATTKVLTAEITVSDANFDKSSTVEPINGGTWNGVWVLVGDGVYTTKVTYDAESAAGVTFGLKVNAKDVISGDEGAVLYTYGANTKEKSDKGGNLTTTANGNEIEDGGTAFVLDVSKPNVEVVMSKARAVANQDGVDYYSEPVTARITVTDPNFVADVETSTVTITSPDEVSKDVKISGVWEPVKGASGAYERTIEFPDNAAYKQYAFEVLAKDAVDYEVTYKYGDNAAGDTGGKLATTAEGDSSTEFGSKFVVDSLGPEVEVSLDAKCAGTQDGVDYYDAETVTATVKVKDINFTGKDDNPSNLIKVTTAEGKAPSGAYTIDEAWTPGADGESYKANIVFEQNAANEAYQFTVNGVSDGIRSVDYAYGNQGDNVSTKAGGEEVSGPSFVVDNAKPEIVSVQFLDANGEDAQPVGTLDSIDYWNAGTIKIKVTAKDDHFDATSSAITASGQVVTAAEDQKWTETSEPGTWETTIEFGENVQFADGKLVVSNLSVDAADVLYSITKSEEHKVTATYADYPKGYNGTTFVLDATEPKVAALTWSVDPVGAAGGVDYYADKPTMSITVEDNTFDADNTDKTLNALGLAKKTDWAQQDGANQWIATYEFGENQVDVEDVASNISLTAVDKVYVAAGEGAISGHSHEYSYKDGTTAGEEVLGSHASETFVVDCTAPEVSVVIDQELKNTHADTDYYGSVTDGVLTATVTVKDNNFDPNDEVYKVDPTLGEWSGWTLQDDGSYTGAVTYKENFGTTNDLKIETIADMVYTAAENKDAVKADHTTSYDYGASNTKDKADKSTAGSCFVVDLTAPTLTASETEPWTARVDEGGEAYGPYLFYKGEGSGITVSASDLNGIEVADVTSPFGLSAGTSVGSDPSSQLRDIGVASSMTVGLINPKTYQERVSNNETMKSSFMKLTDYAGNWTLWNISPTGQIYLDNTGEAASAQEGVSIKDSQTVPLWGADRDEDSPVLSWVGEVSPGYYNTTDLSTTLNIFEVYFDKLRFAESSKVIATIHRLSPDASLTDDPVPILAGGSDVQGGGDTWTRVIPFNQEGHYYVKAQFADRNGNMSNELLLGSDNDVDKMITIDTTAPVIQDITFDNNDVRNGKYYKAGRTATITIIEHNWDPSLAVITTNGSIGGWSDDGDTHTCTVSFTTDGTYNLSVSCTDKAGNTAAPKSVDEFVVDLTAPTITFTEVAAQTAYKDVIAPVINYHDEANFDSNGMTYTLTGSKRGAKTLPASQSVSGNDGTVAYTDFERIVENDDIYTLQAHLVDLAGNEAENSITFSVNRFGSNFIVVNAEDFESGYIGESEEVLVREINVCGALTEKHGVAVTHGLTTENLKMKAASSGVADGFFIQSGADEAGWSTYLYNIGEGNFDDDGNYHVVVSSTDHASNLNNSASYYNPDKHEVADAEVSFILDKQPPIIEGLNIVDGSTHDAAKDTVTFTVTDNIGVKNVVVDVDGDSQEVEPDMGGLCTVQVDPKAWTSRSMTITATDLADHSATADVHDFHMTTDFVELNLPLVVGAVVVVLAAAGGFFAFGARRRKQEEEEQQ